MARGEKGPNLGLWRLLLISFLIIGYVKTDSEKDFEFNGESYRDDEDFLNDEAESGSGDGSGEVIVGTFGPPTLIPALYRATINVTSVAYTPDIAAAGRNIGNLGVVYFLQAALESVLSNVRGTVRIRIVDLQPGSLMVTFDIDADGRQTEEEIVEILKKMLNSGTLENTIDPSSPFKVSLEGFDFRKSRDSYACPISVGRVPEELWGTKTSKLYLLPGLSFPCSGFVVSWNVYRVSYFGGVNIGVFRQTSDLEFTLLSKTHLQEGIEVQSYILPNPIYVQKGDFIGVFYDSPSDTPVIAMTTSADNELPPAQLYETYTVNMYSLQEGQVLQPVTMGAEQIMATVSVQAEMSYQNIPDATPAPPVECTADQWTCKNGDCIDKNYYCDQQVDCYDGSDEENCPETKCQEGEFLCGDGQQCIPEQFLCNSINDCGDNSDEKDCDPVFVPVDPPGNVRVLLQNYNTVVVEWDGPSGAIRGYKVYYATTSGLPLSQWNVQTVEGAASSTYISNLEPNKDYYFIVQAYSSAGDGLPSATLQINTGNRAPDPILISSFRESSDSDKYTITWYQPRDADRIVSYIIKYRQVSVQAQLTEDGFYSFASALTPFNSITVQPQYYRYTLTGLRPDSYYEVEVSAINAIGSSEPQDFIFKTALAGCATGEWQCANGGCISLEERCDNAPDCSDRSDEIGCEVPVCNEGQMACPLPDGTITCVDENIGCECAEGEFQCVYGLRCIAGDRRCDGTRDCEDNSDEEGCPTATPSCIQEIIISRATEYNQCMLQLSSLLSGGFTVASMCTDEGKRAFSCFFDFVRQCPEILTSSGQDAMFAQLGIQFNELIQPGGLDRFCQSISGCQPGQWQCADNTCIPESMYCDGVAQCEDRSDEASCKVCTEDQFTCRDGKCVLASMECDGVPQCEDGSDEFNCGCGDGMYECADGNCVKDFMRCDGVPQCEDGSDETGCPAKNCPPSDFQCVNTPRLTCIDNRLVCDGYPDCIDASDEQGCPGCNQYEFTCVSDGDCIPAENRCNGIVECRDRSDELNCTCTDQQFQCGDGICIDVSRRCDRRVDCQDQSDELACPCRTGEFQCLNGNCINAGRKCDGSYDCSDRSDELNCTLRCAEGELACIPDRRCIPESHLCNQVFDCSDKSDELNCKRCTENEFECESDRSCISLAGRCNGRRECSDGSDEVNCPTLPPITVSVSPRNLRIRAGAEALLTCVANGLPGAKVMWSRASGDLPMQSAEEFGKLMIPVAKPMDSGIYICTVVGFPDVQASARLEVVDIGPTPQPEPGECGRDEAVCQNGQCIRREYRCDGEKDCEDGSDEPADCYNNLCEPNEFQCPSGQCVMKIWRCDGEADCEDGFDESNCQERDPNAPCGHDEFQCVSGNQCVPLAYQCDQEIDCLDRSDEIGCAPPVITVPPISEVEVELGGSFTIICEAMGVPTPLIVWRLNWGNIASGERVAVISKDGKGSLTISDVRYEDAGAYTCEAINNRGSIFAIPDALVIVRAQAGPCSPPFFNFGALTTDECIRCFCFGQSVQCFSSDLQVSRIALANRLTLVNRANADDLLPVEQGFVEFKPNTREHQVRDMNRALPQGRYYWKLPEEFLGERLTSYGGELKYTAFYNTEGRRQETTSDADVVISGNGITLYYRARTVPSPGVPTSVSVPLVENVWEKTDGPRRGDTPISQYATREDLMTVLQNVEYILVRGTFDRSQIITRIGGLYMTTAVDYPTDYGRAVMVEECTCPTGYTGLSCQNCAAGFTRIQSGPYLGECVTCNCNGHSNDCDPYTGECLNCQHNTYGPQCQLCLEGFYGDPRRGTPGDCQACPCPLTDRANQFSRSCFVDTDNQVTCANCPQGYQGRRCERCAEGYIGDPMTPGSSCQKSKVDEYCDPRGSQSSQPDPRTQRCECKENVVGERCDSCAQNSFYLSRSYENGCVQCFCMGVSYTCQSTSWNRAQVGISFTRENDDEGFSMIDFNGITTADQRFRVNTNNRELIYRFNEQAPVDDDSLYFSLPKSFLENKVTAYGGTLRFTINYTSRQGASLAQGEPLILLSGNDITLIHRATSSISPNRALAYSVSMFEQNWQRFDGADATREHLLMALADLKSILIRASYDRQQSDARLQDLTMDIAEDRRTRQDRAYAVEQCVCPVGYRGLSCEDCDTGYTRSGGGIYLGLCEPCNCNGHSSGCDPETGVCRNCQHNTQGNSCETCAVGYYGDATRGTRNDCQKCPCPLTESPNQFSPSCILDTDNQVTCNACPAGHTGRRCETCVAGYSGNPLQPGDYCKIGPSNTCDCDSRGTVPNTQCDAENRQCQCKPYTQGQRCARCREGHFYLEANNPQGCLTCFCSGITNQCVSSNYFRDSLRPQLHSDGSHNFVLMNRRMNNIISDGFVVDATRNQVTYNRFEGVQRERESLFFQLPAKFRGDKVTSYGGYLRFTLEFNGQRGGQPYRDVDLEIISAGQQLRLYYLFESTLEEGKTQTYEILLRESSFNDLRSNTAPTRETFMTILSNVEGFLIRATYSTQMASVTLRDVSMDTAIPTPTNLGGAPMVEDCRCPEGYTGMSCQRCDQGYLRVSEQGGLGRCVRCNCNGHAQACDPDSGRCLECQHNTEGDRCERCVAGYYGDATSGTPNDCRPCPCPLTTSPNQFSRTCYLADDRQVTCDRCPTGYAGRNCEVCAQGYVGNPTEVGGSCRPSDEDLRPDVSVTPIRVEEPEGSSAVFRCAVSGQGPFNVVWSRLDSRQLPDNAYVSPRYELTIRDLTTDNSGRYICTATNAFGVTRQEVQLTVISGRSPLQVRIDQPRLEIEEGMTARFVCSVVSGSQGISILSWSKQGGVIPSRGFDQNGVLIIPNVRPADAGTYVCMGSDMLTIDEVTAVLIVKADQSDPPVVRIEPRYQTVEEGKPVRFSCIATGGAPTIEWHRGPNRQLNPEATVSRDGVLRIPRVRAEDEADYFCEATNEHGTTKVRTILYVTRVERPEITVIVRRTSVVTIAGQTALLECYTQDETGRITLFWSRANGLPPGSTQEDGLLTIPSVQPSYAGNYVCTGTDTETGRTSTAITVLEVNVEQQNEAPTATVEPERLNIPMGTTGTLRCITTGKPAPTVKWIKSRAELAPNHQVSGNTLRITQATMEDRGIYVCVVENVAGMDQSWSVVEVERRMRPKIDLYPNTTQRITLGGNALFQCRVMDGDPPPKVTWARVGGLPMSERVEVMENGVIMFKRVTQEEQGSYICTASNDMGVVSATATLAITGPPSITLAPSKTVYAIVGQRVTLECTGEGDPTPNVYWIEPVQARRGDLLPQGETATYPFSQGSAVLNINSASEEDSGYYKCVATNTGGRTEDNVQLIVRREQNQGVSIQGPSTLSVVEGQSVELICTAPASRNPRILWRRREGALPPGHSVSNGVLTLVRFRNEYAGEYICSTVTPQATYEASVFIIVTVAPRLSISPQRIMSRAGDTVQLRCTASGTGPFNIEWSKVDGQMNPSASENNGILEIPRITAADAGRYRCVVQSSTGTSDGFAIVEVTVPPTVIVSNRQVAAEVNRIAELRCDVSGSPPPVVTWEKEIGNLPPQHSIQNGILTIYNVQSVDEGRYICTATSSSGSARDYAVLQVTTPGTIVPGGGGRGGGGGSNVDTKVVNVGDRVSMECIVTGTPLPTITWSRDDGPLPKDVIKGDGILIIPQARIEDAGTYTCLAVNEAGSVTSKVVLYVKAQPLISAPTTTSAALGGSVSLVCDASGYPSPDITWYRKDGQMPDDYTVIDGDLIINRVRPEDAGTYVCHAENQYGKSDTPVNLNVGALVPQFNQDPNSYMAFRALEDVYLDFDVLLRLRPESTEGLVLYNGQYEDGGGDFVCFGLNEGYPEFRFDVGSGPAVIRGNNTLSLNEWHTIKLSRDKKKGSMVVNEEPAYTGESPGFFTGLDLEQNMYLGSVPDFDKIPSVASFREGFVGTISEVQLKGISMNLGAEALEIVGVVPSDTCRSRPCYNGATCIAANVKYGFKCICPQGFTGNLCQERGERCYPGACGDQGRCMNLDGRTGFRCICPIGKTGTGCARDVALINPFFNRTSFISYPRADDGLFNMMVYMEFKPKSLSDGIIMYQGNNRDGTGDFMALIQKDGYLEYRYDTGSGTATIRSTNPLRIGEWTRVTASRKNRDGTLLVNDDEPIRAVSWPPIQSGTSPGSNVGLNLKLPLYLGGPDPLYRISTNAGTSQGFIGCIAELAVNDRQVDLLNDAIESMNIVDCGERRLCERQPCENGAVCEDLPGPDYRCLCSSSYTGKNCETEVNICLTNSPCQYGAPCSITQDGYRCDCPLGRAGRDCQYAIDLNTRLSFAGDGYIEFMNDILPHAKAQERQTISFKMSTTQPNGLIFWQGAETGTPLRGGDHIALGVKDGYLEYSYEMGSGPAMIMSRNRVDDGQVHRVYLERLGREGTLTVDSDETVNGSSQGFLQMLNAPGNIFVGGVSIPSLMTDGKYSENYVGCIEDLVIHGKGPLQPQDAVKGFNVLAECGAR